MSRAAASASAGPSAAVSRRRPLGPAGPARFRPGPRTPTGAARSDGRRPPRPAPGRRSTASTAQRGNSPTATFWATSTGPAVPHLARPPRSTVGRMAPAARACAGWENPAIAASCSALAMPSSLTSRSQTAALFSAVGISARTWVASRCAGRGRVGRARPRRSRQSRPRRARPARPAASRTGRCRRSARAAAPSRPASRRSRSAAASPSFAPASACTAASWVSLPAPGPSTASSRRAAVTVGQPVCGRPVRFRVRADRNLQLRQHPLQYADLVLGGQAADGQDDEVPGPHQRVPGHLPHRRPEQGPRQRLGDVGDRRRSRWPAMPSPAGPCSRSGRRR